jgi:hypothetical protein
MPLPVGIAGPGLKPPAALIVRETSQRKKAGTVRKNAFTA